MVNGGRAALILSIPVQEVSLGSPRVGTIHVQSPTPHTPPLPAYFGQFSHQYLPLYQTNRRCARGATGPRAARARSPASGRATGRAARKKRGAYWCAGAAAP